MQVIERTAPSIKDVAAALLPTAARTSGVHVSEIIKIKLLQIDPERYGQEFAEDQRDNLWHAGYLWEEIIAKVFAEGRASTSALVKGSEIVDEGIYLTPDWIEIGTDPAGVEHLYVSETKASWKSSREWGKDPNTAIWDKRFVGWRMQFGAYARALQTLHARLHVLWMNDDYTKFLPKMRTYEITFTPRELDENWAMLKNTARKQGWL